MKPQVIRAGRPLTLELQEVWQYRDLLYAFIIVSFKVRYKQATLGILWAILQPLSAVAIFSFILGKLVKVPSDNLPYPLFTFSGMIVWNYFATALTQASQSLVHYSHLITKVYFPRIILPLAKAAVGGVDFLISFIALSGLILWYGFPISWRIIFFPFFSIVTLFTALSLGLWLSSINYLYRDVQYVLPFFIQLGLFLTPIVYPTSILPEAWQWLYALNPMVGIVEGFRWCLFGQGKIPALFWASLLMVSVVFTGGLFYFKKVERLLNDAI
ncbi:MAG: ABC transporter permease [Bacteroidia bacterium]|nr:ABC transporter permease [Bacteroidia bacterium]MDW8088168.1 ABC transporter permease [Bacteroidia bacterium]